MSTHNILCFHAEISKMKVLLVEKSALSVAMGLLLKE